MEHRLFSFISINWRGKPLTSYKVIINLIAFTATKTGLKVKAALSDERAMRDGIGVFVRTGAKLLVSVFHGSLFITLVRPWQHP